MTTWHYTIGDRIEMILVDGLKLTTARTPSAARPCVWFTISNAWDETANKSIPAAVGGRDLLVGLNRDLTHRLGRGLVRIGVSEDTAPYGFEDWKKMSNCPPEMARDLHDSAIEAGVDPSDWRVSFNEVPPSKFELVEYWNSDRESWNSQASTLPDPPGSETVERLILQGIQTGTLVVRAR